MAREIQNYRSMQLHPYICEMVIRKITQEEVWPIRQVVMWPEKPIEFVKINGDHDASHFGLYIDGQLASVISCFETDGEMQFRKFATRADSQKKGLGTHLLNHVIHEARKKGTKRLWCNARCDKTDFYKRFGLTETKEPFHKDGLKYIEMELRFQ
jgi:predicted GNAT family N-acyltransferase